MFKEKENKATCARLFGGTLPSSLLSVSRPGDCLVSMETLKPGSGKASRPYDSRSKVLNLNFIVGYESGPS